MCLGHKTMLIIEGREGKEIAKRESRERVQEDSRLRVRAKIDKRENIKKAVRV